MLANSDSCGLQSPVKVNRGKAKKSLFADENDAPSPSDAKPSTLLSLKKRIPSECPEARRLVEARRVLSTALPDALVGREKQSDAIRKFLDANLLGKSGKKRDNDGRGKRSLYISGPPGTGKTTSLSHLLKEYESLTKTGGDPLRIAFVNCMQALGSSTSASSIYSRIAEAIVAPDAVENHKDSKSRKPKIGSSSNDARKLIESFVRRRQVLLVLDEVDQLDSKDQEVLYSVFEWPYLEGSRLTLMGIANALDLTDRVLPRLKTKGRICPEELTFPAYTREEIQAIINARLGSLAGVFPADGGAGDNATTTIITPGAVRFLAAKISALSGDVRKALDVCRRSIELAEVAWRKQTILCSSPSSNASSELLRSSFKPIDVPQILKILNEIYCSSAATASLTESNSDLPLQQKIIVACLLLMTSYGKFPVKEVSLSKLHETYAKLCKKRSMKGLCMAEFAGLCSLLDARGFFTARKVCSKVAKETRISLRIDEDEVQAALKDKALLSGILKDVECIAK